MAAVCPTILHFCVVRATRLDSVGAVAAGPDNSYVSDNPVSLQMTPNVSAGEDRELKGGCGCIVAQAKDPDRFKRWDLELTMAALEPGLMEMLLGVSLISDGADPIGINGVDQSDCGFTPSLVAFEGWADAYDGDAPDPVRPYVYVAFPATSWQMGQMTLQNDFATPPFTGFSRKNSSWGNGPYDDTGITDTIDQWAISQTDQPPPTAACGYATVSAS